MTDEKKLYQIYELSSGNPWMQPMSRKRAVEEAQRLLNKPAGYSIVIYPIEWEKEEGEIHVGTQISEDFPGDTDSYYFVIKPV